MFRTSTARFVCLAILLQVLPGCSCGRRSGNPLDGAVGNDRQGNDSQADSMIDDCSEQARWVYALGIDGRLIRFYPDMLRFEAVGTVDCGEFSQTFSMAVDRDATAWVLYENGRLYRVSTTDASCEPTSFVPGQHDFEVFGMGFASNERGSEDETLFIAGGPVIGVGFGNATLGTLTTDSLTVSPIGLLDGSPELTGTGAAELWGFLPDTNPMSVQQFNKTDASTLQNFPLNPLGTGTPRAWAFAFWGGRFYMFLQTDAQPSTNVWRLDPTNGNIDEVVHDSGFVIVGAGVSTCAPVIII